MNIQINAQWWRKHTHLAYALSFSALLSGMGCSGVQEFPLGKVSGKVVCEGKPVPKAIVFFEPINAGGDSALIGKQGFGLTDDEGQFTISTYGESDGAVLGKHKVRVGKSESSPPCACALIADNVLMEVEVNKGNNEFELSLKKATAAERKREQESQKRLDD